MKKHPVILSMIVRDEALALRRCLASAAPHIDAIVILDTGSNPEEPPEPETGLRTRQIAEEFGAVFREGSDGCDERGVFWSFAEARNRALALAEDEVMMMQGACREADGDTVPEPWILWLDAADVLAGGERLQGEIAAAETEGRDCLRFPTEMLDSRGRVTLRFPRDRVVRSGRYRWQGAVHELLVSTVEGPFSRIRATDPSLRVQRPHLDRPTREADRNFRILNREVRRHAQPRELYYLGMDRAERGDFAEARRWLDVYLRVSRDTDERAAARMMLAELHAARRDQDEALACALRAHAERPNWPAPKVLIGKLLYLAASRGEEKSQNIESATHFLLSAIEHYQEPITHVPIDPRKKVEARMLLGRCSMLVSDYNLAIAAFDGVLDDDPDDPAAKSLRTQCVAARAREREFQEASDRADEELSEFRAAESAEKAP